MTIAFTIPTWLLWLIGIPIGIAVIGLAVIGASFMWSFRDGIGWH